MNHCTICYAYKKHLFNCHNCKSVVCDKCFKKDVCINCYIDYELIKKDLKILKNEYANPLQ